MKLLQFFQNNKLLVHYSTIFILIVGVLVFLNIQREARPNVNFNRVNVSAVYPGAAPSAIEELVIDPIEEKIAEVDGVEEYRSVAFVGAGSISIQIDDDYPDPQKVVDEVRRKISEVKDLPIEVKDPSVTERKAENIPVLNLALYGDMSPFDFKLETEKLRDFLRLQEGVQSVDYSGISDLHLKVKARPDRLDKHDVTIEEIYRRLSGWAKQKPGGLFENQSEVANLTIGKDLNRIEQLEKFVIQGNDSGQQVELGDVAEIGFDLETLQSASFFGDQEAVLFTIIKKPFFDSIRTVDQIKLALERYQSGLPDGLKLKLYKDQSVRIRDKLRIVTTNAITGLILVLIILLIFLDWRSALVTSIGIPISILGGISLLYFFGHTMNSLVVVGIIIVLGMLVDDAIVVCENIYSYLEKGFTPMKAALLGTQEIALPVIAAVLTTVFAFLPIAFMKEIIGQFLRVIPLTVVAMLAISLIESLIILPTHAEEIMRPQKKKSKNHFFEKVNASYRKYLDWSIHRRVFILLGLCVFLAISAFQGKKIFERFSLFPAEGLDGLSVRIELPKNSPLQKTKVIVQKMSESLIAVSDGTFDNIYSNLGSVTTGGSSGSRQSGSHLAMLFVTFTSDSDFIYKEKKVVREIRNAVSRVAEKNEIKASVTLDRPGPPIGKPIQIQITLRDLSYGEKVTDSIKSELKKIDGVVSLETDLDGDNLKYQLEIDNEFAVSEGVDPSVISRTIFSATTGLVASEILKNNEKVEISVGVQREIDRPINEILDLKVRNTRGQAVPLKNFVKLTEERGPSSIQRLNGLRTITLFGEVNESLITGKEANAKIRPYITQLRDENPTIRISTGGGEKDRMNAVKDTMRLYGIALILIFMVISLTFRSVLYPFLVLTAIPFGLSGVVWSLVAHGKSLSIMGIIGIVGLSGVVVNVSIIYLKFVQDRLKTGKAFNDCVIDAGVARLRPIVMTTMSTLIGLLPTIYGVGGVDTFVQPIALVLGWGLFVAALLTMTCLPALLSFFTVLRPTKTQVT